MPTLPAGMHMDAGWNSALFVQASVDEVYITLAIAMLLVVFVIYLFLGTKRAALIPAVTVPICLVATFAGLYAFDLSINLLTLLAMVLSIGLVVDDSIVVLENVQRRIELGEPPLMAALRGTREVAFAVIAYGGPLEGTHDCSAGVDGADGGFLGQPGTFYVDFVHPAGGTKQSCTVTITNGGTVGGDHATGTFSVTFTGSGGAVVANGVFDTPVKAPPGTPTKK